jgi:hypothetical protein
VGKVEEIDPKKEVVIPRGPLIESILYITFFAVEIQPE